LARKRRKKDSQADLRALAFHEAGHAVMASLKRQSFLGVSIERDSDSEGHVMFRPLPPGWEYDLDDRGLRRRAVARAACLLAGPQAEAILNKREVELDFGQSDIRDAWHFLEQIGNGSEAGSLLAKVSRYTQHQFRRPHVWAATEALALMLLGRRTISAKEARQMIRQAMGQDRTRRCDVEREQTRARKPDGPTFAITTSLPPGMAPEEARKRCVEAISALLAEAPARESDAGSAP
jgi:hypothetical protein